MLQFDRVRETTDAVVQVTTELVELFAKVNKVLKLNSNLSISYTPATKVVTVANATDIFTSTAHGFVLDQKLRFTNSGGALPTGLLPFTDYFVIAGNLATNTFQVATTKGGASINMTTDGTGTNTANPVPDYISEETNGTSNLSGRTYDRIQVSNAIGSLTQFQNLMNNVLPTQGDHIGTLNQLARAQG